MTEHTEQIKFDIETEEFYVERTTSLGKNESFERLPLTQWGLTKKATVYAHIIRKIESVDFEEPVKIVNYSLPLTYEILDNEAGKYVYLKLVEQSFEGRIRDNVKANWKKVMMRNLENGVVQEVPLPNSMFRPEEFSFLKITRGKATELTKKDIYSLWKEGLCIGSYDYKLENRII